MKILINGGCGFLGSNLASYAIEKGYNLTIFDNLSRLGSDRNREWLNTLGKFTFIHGDTRNKNDVENIIREGQFDAVFHLAGQVTMTKSITDPYPMRLDAPTLISCVLCFRRPNRKVE